MKWKIGKATEPIDNSVRSDEGADALLGQVKLSELRRRSRERSAVPLVASSESPTPRIIQRSGPSRLKRWLRHPTAFLFLLLGALTTLSLVYAASRLDDDGSLGLADWFRIVIVAIVALAFFVQAGSLFVRLFRLRKLLQLFKGAAGETQLNPTATIASHGEDQLAERMAPELGRLTHVERARANAQMRVDDAFWIMVNVTILLLGGFTVFGLGFSSIRDISNGGEGAWPFVRLVLCPLSLFGLVSLLRRSIGQLRLRRQRRRKRAIKRMLRYLLWWGNSAPSRAGFGRTVPALAVLTPMFLLSGVAVATAAFSPWPQENVASSILVAASAAEPAGSPTQLDSEADQPPGAQLPDSAPEATQTSQNATSESASTSSTNNSESSSTLTPTTAAESGPTTDPDVVELGTTTSTSTTVTTSETTVTTTASSATTSTTKAPTTTSTTKAPTTTSTTKAPTTTSTTKAPTTTTATPAPLMSINFLSNGFFCNSGTTRRIVTWNVSGDPGGQVNIFRLRSDGNFVQIGFTVAFISSLVDTPPTSGQYQYWVLAQNSDGKDALLKTPGSSFFTFTAGSCIG